ncbi:hypothetical protein P3W24_11985 [Luteibacter sp. PPL201]|jgi:hypothetical protein|uniref:Uncharacterized protein n=1 Tax=Luteibacter sahnii TaxID=3021977 RepID=A0ABT6BC30_9GAMM|nr:hypothetical protein [Luteibacter sp. PPL193]MDY1547651.1 hypothetical protein [Luteibacter sp. PPL193]
MTLASGHRHSCSCTAAQVCRRCEQARAAVLQRMTEHTIAMASSAALGDWARVSALARDLRDLSWSAMMASAGATAGVLVMTLQDRYADRFDIDVAMDAVFAEVHRATSQQVR